MQPPHTHAFDPTYTNTALTSFCIGEVAFIQIVTSLFRHVSNFLTRKSREQTNTLCKDIDKLCCFETSAASKHLLPPSPKS